MQIYSRDAWFAAVYILPTNPKSYLFKLSEVTSIRSAPMVALKHLFILSRSFNSSASIGETNKTASASRAYLSSARLTRLDSIDKTKFLIRRFETKLPSRGKPAYRTYPIRYHSPSQPGAHNALKANRHSQGQREYLDRQKT